MRIGIVGGGLSCIGSLQAISDYLDQNEGKEIKVDIYEKSNNAFYGLPYNPDYIPMEGLLTDPPRLMYVKQDGFLKWLYENQDKIKEQRFWRDSSLKLQKQVAESIRIALNGEDAFLPRVIYGMYFKHVGDELVKKIKQKGGKVRIQTNTFVKKIDQANNNIEGNIYDKILLVPGAATQRGTVDNYIFNGNVKRNIRQQILDNIRNGRRSCTVLLKQSTITALDAHRIINDVIQKLREEGSLPSRFKVYVDCYSRSFKKIPVPFQEDYMPHYAENKYLNQSEFDKAMVENKDMNKDAIDIFWSLYQKEKQYLKDEFDVQSNDKEMLRNVFRIDDAGLLDAARYRINDPYQKYKR